MWKEGTDLVIKRSIFSIVRCCLFVVVLIASIIYGGFDWKFLLFDLLCVVCLVNLLNCPPITIGKNGIEEKKINQLSWEQIDYAYITERKRSRHITYYLNVQFHDEKGEQKEVEFDLNKYSYNQEEVERAINYWSGREIGNVSDRNRDEMLAELRRNEGEQAANNLEELSKTMLPLFKKETMTEKYAFIIGLGIFGFTLYILLKTKEGIEFYDLEFSGTLMSVLHKAVYLVGMISISFFGGSLFTSFVWKKFNSQSQISNLTKEERTSLYKMVDEKWGESNWLQNAGVSLILSVLCILGAYWLMQQA